MSSCITCSIGSKTERFVDKVTTTQSPFTFKIMGLHAEYEVLHNFSVVMENDWPCIGCLCKSPCNLEKCICCLLCTQHFISITFLNEKFTIQAKLKYTHVIGLSLAMSDT